MNEVDSFTGWGLIIIVIIVAKAFDKGKSEVFFLLGLMFLVTSCTVITKAVTDYSLDVDFNKVESKQVIKRQQGGIK